MPTELVRLLLVMVALGYASMSDIKTYEVRDRVWLVLCAVGTPLMVYDVLSGSLSSMGVLASVLISAGAVSFVHLLYMLGIADVFGLADVKGVLALSLVLPTYPFNPPLSFSHLSIFGYPREFFGLSVLVNAFLLGIGVVAYIMVKNLCAGSSPLRDGQRFFAGFKVSPSELSSGRLELIEVFDEDGCSQPSAPHEPDEHEMAHLLSLQKRGMLDEVWVAPKVPFMVLLFGGALTCVLVGDLLMALLTVFLSLF